jgi:hypothetical protein
LVIGALMQAGISPSSPAMERTHRRHSGLESMDRHSGLS